MSDRPVEERSATGAGKALGMTGFLLVLAGLRLLSVSYEFNLFERE